MQRSAGMHKLFRFFLLAQDRIVLLSQLEKHRNLMVSKRECKI